MAFNCDVTVVNTAVTEEVASNLHKTSQLLHDSEANLRASNLKLKDAISCPGCEELFMACDKIANGISDLATETEKTATGLEEEASRCKKLEQELLEASKTF